MRSADDNEAERRRRQQQRQQRERATAAAAVSSSPAAAPAAAASASSSAASSKRARPHSHTHQRPPSTAAAAAAVAHPSSSQQRPRSQQHRSHGSNHERRGNSSRSHPHSQQQLRGGSAASAASIPPRLLTDSLMSRVAAATRVHDGGGNTERKESPMSDDDDEAEATVAAGAEDSSSSGSDFLLSQAEIRDKQRRREAQKAALAAATATASDPSARSTPAAAASSTSAPPPPARARLSMPGYVFDAARNRYFKLLPSHIHSAAAGRDADDQDDDAHAAGADHGRARPSSHASLQFASLRVAGDPSLHAQDWHTKLSATAATSGLLHSKKKRRTDVAASAASDLLAAAVRAAHPASLVVDHNLARGRSVILGLRAREVGGRSYCRSLAGSRLASHFVPALLRPLPSLLFRSRQSLAAADAPLQSHSVCEFSAEQGLAYDASARLLSVAGKRAIGSGDPERSWIATYSLSAAPRAAQMDSSSDSPAAIVSPPFSLDLLHFLAMSSPVTSLHRFTVPWVQPFENADIWAGGFVGEQPAAMMAATLLGSGAAPGAFKLWSEISSEQQQQPQSGPNIRVQIDYALREGSCFTSAFSASHKLVSLGCSKGGQIMDVLPCRRLRDLHTGKSDIFAQTWLQPALTGGGECCVLSGTRNGIVQIDDLRARAAASHPFRLSSSVCFLDSMRADPHLIVAAAVDGSMATYDLRRTVEALSIATAASGARSAAATASSSSSTAARPHSASSSSKHRPSASPATAAAASSSTPSLLQPVLSYAGQVNSFDVLRPCLVESESCLLSGLFSGGVDGRLRGWDVRAGGSPLLELDPLAGVASLPRRRVPRAIKHVAWLDDWHTVLCGSEDALSALVLHAR